MKAQGITVKEWEFEAESVDKGAERVLTDQRGYNPSRLDGTAMRYVYVKDKQGRVRDLFDVEV